MFLKLLKIEVGEDTVREIPFKKGLNLIIDETKTTTLQESGNNVGKTTVLRLIDFCLGGDGINVYKDSEFKDKTNTQIEAFLKESNVIISLIMKKDLDDNDSEEIIIRRNFLSYKNKIQEINGIHYNGKDFDLKLKQLVFDTNVERPTFRQMISKNIRYEKSRLDNTLKVLHFSTTFEQYEALYFFWFGIGTDTAYKKQMLYASKATEEALLRRLRKDGSLSEIKQSLSVIARDIQDLDKKKSKFNINEFYQEDLDKLNEVRADINRIATVIARLDIRREIILESKHELEKGRADIDVGQLEEIYKSAKRFIPDLHVKFSQMLSFHNSMLTEKIKFVTNEIPSIDADLSSLHRSLKLAITKESELAGNLKKSGAIEELEELVSKENLKYEQRGRYEEQQKQWETSTLKLEKILKELGEINAGIASQDATLEGRIAEFNRLFSSISERLYDEQFILSQDRNDRAIELKISSIGGNLGTGKKKGQIAAFDIAYIQFCDENYIPCLHFILHDQVESIHDNQLTLLAEIVGSSNIQFVVPVLHDKLPPDLKVEDYKILSLSQDDKLFRV